VREVRTLGERGEVERLVAMLSEPSWFVRREVVSALARLGDAALLPLLDCLEAQRADEARVAATVDALVGSTGSEVEAVLIARAATAERPAVLADLAQILGRRRSRAAYEVLTRLTTHRDDNVAVGAIEALGRLGGRAAVDALIVCVKSAHFFRTFPAIDVLGRSGDPRAVEPLSELLSDSRYALEAARALGRTADRRAVTPLTALLTSPSDSNVRVACLALLELCERHAQLYGSASVVQQSLRRAGSEAIVRRLVHSVTRADQLEAAAICWLLGELQRESATPLLLSLLDGDPEIAEAAGKALLEIGRSNEDALFNALRDGDSKRRKALLPVVVSLSTAAAVASCLDDASADVRVLACATLARIGAVAAVPALFALLVDESQRVVHAAVAALQSLGTERTEALALAAADDPRSERAALRLLAYFGFESALPLFARALEGGEPPLRDAALQGLSLIERPEAHALLLRAATDTDAGTRAAATRAMGRLPDDATVTESLLAALNDVDPWVRYYACQALGKRKTRGVEDRLRTLIDDDAGQVRVAAIEALSHAGSDRAAETLRAFVADGDLDMRRAALLGLGLARDQLAVPVLVQAALHGDSATRLVALSALSPFSDERVVPVWASAARDGLEQLRVAAINLLAERAGDDAAAALVQLLVETKEGALVSSALSGPLPDRLSALQSALQVADDDQAAVLVSCIARSRAPAAKIALFQTLASANAAARKAGVNALAALATQEALTAIEQLSRTDPDPEVRRTSQLHLAQ
jgi:HEAT repeat protein